MSIQTGVDSIFLSQRPQVFVALPQQPSAASPSPRSAVGAGPASEPSCHPRSAARQTCRSRGVWRTGTSQCRRNTAPSDSRPNKRHSAYSFRTARIAYPWHPLFGQTLQVSSHRRGKDLQCIYTDERPDLSRELPTWMFDESYCTGMVLGEPQISIEGLLKFAAALEAFATQTHGARSPPSIRKEKDR